MKVEEYTKLRQFEGDYWWFNGRRRIVSSLLETETGSRGKSALEIGCGTGGNTAILKDYKTAYALDFSAEALGLAKDFMELPLIQGTAEMLPFKDESLDLVLVMDVLEHLADDVGCVREVERVLENGGVLILTVPALMHLWSEADLANHHMRRYDRKGIESLAARGGFHVQRLSYWNSFLFLPVLLLKMLKRKNVKKGRKNAKSDLYELPKGVNWLLGGIVGLESRLIQSGRRMPVGVSLVAVLRKKGRNID